MGCCHDTSNQTELIAKDYYTNAKNPLSSIGPFDTFIDAVTNIQHTHDETHKGVLIVKINKAVYIQEDECKVYIVSCAFSDDTEKVYRVVYHMSGLTTVTVQ